MRPLRGGRPAAPARRGRGAARERARLGADSPTVSASAASGSSRTSWPAIDFFNKVAELAEQEGHHPDLHLEGYRNVTVELWTHAIGGLSENDFILAAKINAVPIALRRTGKADVG